MAYEYLDKLNVSDADKQKLRRLGASTPAALLSRIQYSPEARQQFVNYLGDDAAVRSIEETLGSLQSLSDEGNRPPLAPFEPGRGALDPGTLGESPDLLAQREDLIRQIQNLRSVGAYDEAEQKAGELRDSLQRG